MYGFAGVNEPILVHGTRSESWRHINNGGAQVVDISGCAIIGAASAWVANTVYAPGSVVCPTTNNGRAYQTVAGGTSDATEPVWPINGWIGVSPDVEGGLTGNTVADNTCVWQEYIYWSIHNRNGTSQSITACAGLVEPYCPGNITKSATTDFDYNAWRGVTPGFPSAPIQDVQADATSGPVVVSMRNSEINGNYIHTYQIIKTDVSANPVIVKYGLSTGVFGDSNYAFLSSPYQTLRLIEGSSNGQRSFYKERSDDWSYVTPAIVTAVVAAVNTFFVNPQDRFLLDTTSGTITVNINGPNLAGGIVAKPGMYFRIRDPQGTWATNNVTINPQGYKIEGSTSNYICSTNFSELIFTYVDDTIGWQVQVSSYNGMIGPVVVVTSLPSAATAGTGARAFVTDSNATLAGGLGNVVAGTRNYKVPVYSDGTNWRIG